MLLDVLKDSLNVKELRFQSNQMDDSILKNIVNCFTSLQRLKILEITFNELGDESLGQLAHIFQNNRDLEEVILSNNKFGNTEEPYNL